MANYFEYTALSYVAKAACCSNLYLALLRMLSPSAFRVPLTLTASVLKTDTLGGGNMKFYNKLLPLIKLMDKYVPIPGLSLMAVVERNS